ncbi:MAG: hypothetical protein ACRC9R_07930 [Enterovibrio sp.]
MSLFLLLNPKQFSTGAGVDTSDILRRRAKRRKREEAELEEALAVKLLLARQEDIVIPEEIQEDRLRDILQAKLHEAPAPGEVSGIQRINRIRAILLMLVMEE